MPSNDQSFSPFICASFAANYIIGTVFLALPWAFYQSGWLFSLICLAVVCWLENLASDYVLSALARAEWILEEQLNDPEAVPLAKVGKEKETQTTEPKQQCYGSIQSSSTQPLAPLLSIGRTNHKLDLPQVCDLFLNQAGYSGYVICVHLYLYGSLWMFTSVFGNAVATYYRIGYPWAVLALAAIALPLSCLQLTEQKLLQVLLTISRILLMMLMVVTPLVAAASPTEHFGGGEELVARDETPLVDWSGAHRMLPIVVCAAIFHFSIPALATDLGGSNKDQLGQVFAWTFVLVFVVYASIGTVDAWYFGGAIQQSSNVNWSDYHGGTGHLATVNGTTEWVGVAWWAQAISFFVTMFPAINVISVFPLHALVLGNSLMAIWYKERLEEVQQNRWLVSTFRVVAAAPPLVGGLFVRELGTIIDYNGIFGLAIAFIFPSWLYLASVQRCPTTRTSYERLGSSQVTAMCLLIFGVVAQLAVLGLLVWRG